VVVKSAVQIGVRLRIRRWTDSGFSSQAGPRSDLLSDCDPQSVWSEADVEGGRLLESRHASYGTITTRPVITKDDGGEIGS
jgi:hypothetical protein